MLQYWPIVTCYSTGLQLYVTVLTYQTKWTQEGATAAWLLFRQPTGLDLMRNVPHSLGHLVPSCGAVWRGLGGTDWLEGVYIYHWGQTLRLRNFANFRLALSASHLRFKLWALSFLLLTPCLLRPIRSPLSLWNCRAKNPLSSINCWVMLFYHRKEKFVINQLLSDQIWCLHHRKELMTGAGTCCKAGLGGHRS